MNLTVAKSINNLQWNTEHHFLHIKNQHPFIRQVAVQFELGYTDARLIQAYLEDQGAIDEWQSFTDAYEAVYEYEYAFVAGDIAGFNRAFPGKMDEYDIAHTRLIDVLRHLLTDIG